MILSPGARVGPYEVVAGLGAGGMGEVYRARDSRLGRDVALKILAPAFANDPERLHRFEQEARAAAALNHPNIVTLYSVDRIEGMSLLTMELVEGTTLSEIIPKNGLPFAEIVKLAVPLADALSAAHQRGITHRDLKPANVMITPERCVKVLDFGLAKLKEAAASIEASALPTAPVTVEGQILGTVGYMSPEQAEGRSVDHRSDIFSLGIILFEMATGEPPFKGPSPISLLSSIIKDTPPLVTSINGSLPGEFARIVRRTLVKDPEHRYQSAKDVRNDLEELARGVSSNGRAVTFVRRHMARVAASFAALALLAAGLLVGSAWLVPDSVEPIDSVAVLPFVNATGDPDSEYLSDGLGDTIINNLSLLEDLRVVPRTLAAAYKGKTQDPRQIGRDLGVRGIVTGRVSRRGDTLSVQVELVDIETLSQLWGEQYNRRLVEALSVQEDISRAVAETLRTRLTLAERRRLVGQQTADAEAYQLYLRGRHELGKRNDDALKQAIAFFEQAIARDPTYALAHSGLADAYSQRAIWGYLRPGEAYPKAVAAATRAAALDDSIAEAHVSLGITSLMYAWDWPRSSRELQHALSIGGTNADAHRWYGILLTSHGDFEEGFAEGMRAQALDPLSPMNTTNLGWNRILARRYDDAIEILSKLVALHPDFIPARFYLGWAYLLKGRSDLAMAEARHVAALGSPLAPSMVARSYAAAGARPEALKVLNQMIVQSGRSEAGAFSVAWVYAAFGEADNTFLWLEKAYTQRDGTIMFLLRYPEFDRFHSDPRFKDLIRRIGIPSQ